jgi:hypothetical protein
MSSSPSLSPQIRNRLETLIALARLLERAERNELRPSAEEYQRLVEQTKHALQAELPEAALKAVLDAFPAASELYENLHYAQAGLARVELERSVKSEMAASEVLHKLRLKARGA